MFAAEKSFIITISPLILSQCLLLLEGKSCNPDVDRFLRAISSPSGFNARLLVNSNIVARANHCFGCLNTQMFGLNQHVINVFIQISMHVL